MQTLAIDQLAGTNVNTYGGNLNLDSIEQSELDSDTTLTAEQCDDFYFQLDIFKSWKDQLDFTMFDFLQPIFAKYQIDFAVKELWSPREYNFSGDELDCNFNFTGTEKEAKRILQSLQAEIVEYQKDIMQKDGPGYMSLEPQTFDQADIEDYCTIWAIIKKEGMQEEINDAIEDFIETALNLYGEIFSIELYKFSKKIN